MISVLELTGAWQLPLQWEGVTQGRLLPKFDCLPTDCTPKNPPAGWLKTPSCAQAWEVIKEMESNKANFTRAKEKLLQYLVPVLEPNSYIKTSSSTWRKKQVSSLQITDSC